MTLERQEAELLNEALLSAYTYQSLERMLYFELGRHLQQIAPPLGNLQDAIFSVITTAERQGWTDDLVHAAHDANPGNPKIKKFTDQYVRFRGAAPSLERIIQRTNSFLDVAMWRKKLEGIERQVCSIEIGGDHVGTGFLIAHDLVMTNYHVIEDLLATPPNFQPQQVRVRFDFKKSDDGSELNDGVRYQLTDGAWLVDSSPYGQAEGNNDFQALPSLDELDYAVLRIAPRAGDENDAITPGNEPVSGFHMKTRGWIEFPQQTPTFEKGAALFIVQHPDGKPLKMALASDSIISLNGNGTRVRHKTNTEEGSSGSACFDSNWNLVALHHAGDPNWFKPQWNQAVPVNVIRDQWQKKGKAAHILSGAPPAPSAGDGGEGQYSAADEEDELMQS